MKHTINSTSVAVRNFINDHGREPTAKEFDNDPSLPNSRYIQRNFGGLKNLRKELGLTIEDHTTGETRIQTAKVANERAAQYEADIINKLFDKLHNQETYNPAIIRGFAYQQWLPDEKYYANITSDVAISFRTPNHIVLVDFFYPSDKHSYHGCVRSKQRKLEKHPVSLCDDTTYEVWFVCVNDNIQVVPNENFTVLSLSEFWDRVGEMQQI